MSRWSVRLVELRRLRAMDARGADGYLVVEAELEGFKRRWDLPLSRTGRQSTSDNKVCWTWVSGETLDQLTLAPSLVLELDDRFHVFVEGGEMRPCGDNRARLVQVGEDA